MLMKITQFGFIQGIALLIGLPLINITNKFYSYSTCKCDNSIKTL